VTTPETIDYDIHWAESLETYRNHPTSRHRRRFVMNALQRAQLTPQSFVFDYGCGAGLALEEAQARFGLRDDQLGGCDVSATAIARVRARFDSPHFIQGEFPPLDRPIDVAICTEVIEHTAEYARVLAWIAAHLRPGGHVILTTPGTPMDPPDEFYGHIQHFRLRDLTRLLRECGYEVDYAARWGFPLFTLQKWLTRTWFDRVKSGYMEGKLSRKKRAVFTVAYYAYMVHDWIPWGPQLFIRARKCSDFVAPGG
jgi:2-polyprenyl-3-methyl-5-hydroxy-6-metoxy-1,4-benzoquinol methylase